MGSKDLVRIQGVRFRIDGIGRVVQDLGFRKGFRAKGEGFSDGGLHGLLLRDLVQITTTRNL